MYICIKNSGEFAIESAINLLGASVKEKDDAIGIFGSGTKYALAQAARRKIKITITSGNKVYETNTMKTDFRGVSFDVVTLKNKKDFTVIRTPLTTDFGKEDWNDDWFIFREFYSNALDEKDAEITLVSNVNAFPGKTCVYLPYEPFKEYYDNLSAYFRKPENFKKYIPGTGRVYKKGVYVGSLPCNIDMFRDDVRLNECRVMDMDNAKYLLSHIDASYNSSSKELWVAFFQSDYNFIKDIDIYLSDNNDLDINKHIHEALIAVFGANYCICPQVDGIIKDAIIAGYTPVVFNKIAFNASLFNTYEKLNINTYREPSCDELTIINKTKKKIEFLFTNIDSIPINIIKYDAIQYGQADLKNRMVLINESIIQNEARLTQVLIHELGHIYTRAGDYDRSFTAFFVNKLAELCM